MDVLRFLDVTKSFGGRTVLTGVTWSVARGAIVGVIGDNGAGKTTLLRLAAGLLRPSSGRVDLFGQTDPVAARRRLGALLERPGHYDELTVAENLRFFYQFYARSPSERDEGVQATLATAGLLDVASSRAGTLSTGLRQRLALARAAHPWAELVLLDEPFESLDPMARHRLKTWMQAAAARGTTLIISSHTLYDLADLCGTLLLVFDQQARTFGGFADMRRELGLSDASSLDSLYTAYRMQSTSGVH